MTHHSCTISNSIQSRQTFWHLAGSVIYIVNSMVLLTNIKIELSGCHVVKHFDFPHNTALSSDRTPKDHYLLLLISACSYYIQVQRLSIVATEQLSPSSKRSFVKEQFLSNHYVGNVSGGNILCMPLNVSKNMCGGRMVEGIREFSFKSGSFAPYNVLSVVFLLGFCV